MAPWEPSGCFEDQIGFGRDIQLPETMASPLSTRRWDLASAETLRVGPTLAAAPAPPDTRRLEGWFREHFDTLWRMAARLGVPRESVDDVVQEAFITADRRAHDIAAGCERSFLIATTVRVSANYRRRQRTRADIAAGLAREQLPDGPADAEQLLARKQLRSLLDVALDELPHEQRTVLVLHELEGFSAAQIAELLGDPPGTVASRLGRARQKFSRAASRLRVEWQKHR
jgi:RNA polymerase sigma-70 factor, ECF subfamily